MFLILFIFIICVNLFSIRENMSHENVEITHNINTINIDEIKKRASKYQNDIDMAYKKMEENERKADKNFKSTKEFLCEIDEKYGMLC